MKALPHYTILKIGESKNKYLKVPIADDSLKAGKH